MTKTLIYRKMHLARLNPGNAGYYRFYEMTVEVVLWHHENLPLEQ